MEFETSWKNQAVVCVISFLVGAVGVWFALEVKWLLAAGAGLLISGIFFLRYYLKGFKRVRVDEAGIALKSRRGGSTFLPWERMQEVVLAGRSEDTWIFKMPDRNVRLFDDGFLPDQWEELSNEVMKILEKKGIPCKKWGRGKKLEDCRKASA